MSRPDVAELDVGEVGQGAPETPMQQGGDGGGILEAVGRGAAEQQAQRIRCQPEEVDVEVGIDYVRRCGSCFASSVGGSGSVAAI